VSTRADEHHKAMSQEDTSEIPVGTADEEFDAGRWEEFGLDSAKMAGWKAIGFDPFETAMAHGDGFTPSFAVHYRKQLHQTARSWERVGLDTAEGLRWHRAGFAAKEAVRWRSLGVDVEKASTRRAGYDDRSDGSEGPPSVTDIPHEKHDNDSDSDSDSEE